MTPLLRNRAFLLLTSGQAVSMIGTQVSQLALPLLVLDLTGSPGLTGIFVALRSVPPLILLLPAGAWLDRWDRKRSMLICDACRGIALGSIPFALAINTAETAAVMALLGVVALVDGICSTFFTVAENVCLPQVVDSQQLPQALAIDNSSDQISRMAGPTLAGFLYTLGRGLPFAVDAVSYLASVVSLLFIRVPFQKERPGATRQRLFEEIRVGLAYLLGHPALRVLVLLVGGLNIFSYGYPLLLIVRAQELGADAATIGLLFASGGIGGILGAVAAPRLQQRLGLGVVLVLASWIWVLTWPPYAVAPSLGWLAVANAIGWIIVPIHGITQQSYRLQVIPDELQGRVNSVYRLIAFGGQPLSLAMTGLLLQAFGAVATVWLITFPQVALVVAATLRGGLWRLGAQPACSMRSMR